MNISVYYHPSDLPQTEPSPRTNNIILSFDRDVFIFLCDDQARALADALDRHFNRETAHA